jgi:hypothetical protein
VEQSSPQALRLLQTGRAFCRRTAQSYFLSIEISMGQKGDLAENVDVTQMCINHDERAIP